ncbi:MAG TPA: hypothetical protein VGM90_11005 [Kofleriaceae bacterium]
MKDRGRSREYDPVALADPRVVLGLVALATGVARANVDGVALDARWARALDDVRTALAARDDVDQSIVIVVSTAPGGVHVSARRPTGESTERDIDAIDDLGPSLIALVVIPHARRAPVESVFDAELPGLPLSAAYTPPTRAALGVDVGLMLGMRWQGSRGVSGGAFAAVEKGPWLADATIAYTAGASDQPGDSSSLAIAHVTEQTIEIGLDVGRRFELGPVALGVHVGPRLAHVNGSLDDVTFVPLTMPTRYVVPEVVKTRVGGGIRVQRATPARVHLFVGIEASIDLTRSEPSDTIDNEHVLTMVVPLPQRAFGIGLVLGTVFGVAR